MIIFFLHLKISELNQDPDRVEFYGKSCLLSISVLFSKTEKLSPRMIIKIQKHEKHEKPFWNLLSFKKGTTQWRILFLKYFFALLMIKKYLKIDRCFSLEWAQWNVHVELHVNWQLHRNNLKRRSRSNFKEDLDPTKHRWNNISYLGIETFSFRT